MKSLPALLARAARHAANRVSLEEALITDRGLAYAWYRSRLLLLRVPLNVVLHVAEVIAFSVVYELGVIGPMLAIRSLPALGGALWWGALESLRARVRAASERGDWGRAERAVRSFLALSVDVGLLGLGLAVAYMEFWPSEFEGFDIFDAYAIASSLRFFLEIVARTYHAGIFAVQRVQRSWWSLILPDVVEVGIALSLWNVLGIWGFSIATLLGGALGAALTYRYARRAYRQHGAYLPKLFRVGRARGDIERRDYAELGRLALANLATHVDALLILILSRSSTHGSAMPFIVALHALRPLLAAVGSFSRLFYFDFKRLNLRGTVFFEQRFARLTRRSAWLLWALTAPLAVTAHLFLFQGQYRTELALLLVYTGARSLLSLEQLRLFTSERYDALAKGGLAALLALLVARFTVDSGSFLVAATVFILAALALWFHEQNRGLQHGTPAAGELVGVFRWLGSLAQVPGEVSVGAAMLDRHAPVPAHALLDAIRAALPGAVTTRIGRSGVGWYTAFGDDSATTRARLVLASAGCLTRLELPGTFANGVLARDRALRLAPFARYALAEVPPSALATNFESAFPDGRVLRLASAPPAAFFREREHRHLTWRAIQAACLGKPAPARTAASPRTAVYCPHGEPELVFIAPGTSDATAFHGFAEQVERASFSATLRPPT